MGFVRRGDRRWHAGNSLKNPADTSRGTCNNYRSFTPIAFESNAAAGVDRSVASNIAHAPAFVILRVSILCRPPRDNTETLEANFASNLSSYEAVRVTRADTLHTKHHEWTGRRSSEWKPRGEFRLRVNCEYRQGQVLHTCGVDTIPWPPVYEYG